MMRLSRQGRLALWVALVAALLGGQVAWLWLLRGERILNGYAILIGGQLGVGALIVAIAVLLKSTPADAIKLSPGASGRIILAGTCLLQASAVLLLMPVLSEDGARYRLDGTLWLSGVSPYTTTPEGIFESAEKAPEGGLRFDVVDRMVTHRDLATIYPPAAQSIFVVGRLVERMLLDGVPEGIAEHPSWRRDLGGVAWRHRLVVLRIIYVLFFVAGIHVLMWMLIERGISAWWAVLLAWNPLATLEVGGMGHQDAAGVFFLLMALWRAQRGRHASGAAWLALACGIKPVVGIIAAFLWRDAARARGASRGALVPAGFGLVLLVTFVAPLLHDRGYRNWIETGRTFSRQWEANGSFYRGFKHVVARGQEEGWLVARTKEAARTVALMILLLTFGLLWRGNASLAEAAYWLMLAMLLISPVVYPWYLLWALAGVPLLEGKAGWTALAWSATAGVSYLLWRQWETDGRWVLPRGEALWEYLPVYAVLIVELIRRARAQRSVESAITELSS